MNKGKRRKTKRILKIGAIFRAAADATTSSISSRSIINRNRIILSEAQAVWEMGKVLGVKASMPDKEIIDRIVELEEIDDERRNEGKGSAV